MFIVILVRVYNECYLKALYLMKLNRQDYQPIFQIIPMGNSVISLTDLSLGHGFIHLYTTYISSIAFSLPMSSF